MELSINYLEKPFEEYVRCKADVFVGINPLKKTSFKCFLWLPNQKAGELHFYLLLEDCKEYQHYSRLLEKHLHTINVQINITTLEGQPYKNYIIKNAYFSNSNLTLVAKDWHEAFIKYHFPKHALVTYEMSESEDVVSRFYLSHSNLLTSKVFTIEHYTGELERNIASSINISDEVKHLGIASLKTDKYIGKVEANILQICTSQPIKSLMYFYRRIRVIAEFVIVVASFAEQRRLYWYKCSSVVSNKAIENYKTRVQFHNDDETIPLINASNFEEFLKNTLQHIQFQDIKYFTRLLQSYIFSKDYSANAKIILFNSLLEKILKKKFCKKRDEFKEELLKKMHIPLFDLPPIKDLIDIRNDIAHGDDVSSDKLFKLEEAWKILIERVLLSELQWFHLHKTAVRLHHDL